MSHRNWLRDEWRRKYKSAARFFIILNGLGVLLLAVVVIAMPQKLDDSPGGQARVYGACLLIVGLIFSIGVGLVKQWRWAAIAASLWCLISLASAVFSVFGSQERLSEHGRKDAAFQTGYLGGASCPGLLTILMLVSCMRAALAKAPPREELDVDEDLQPDIGGLNPYGQVAVRPERKISTGGLVLLAVGALVSVGGVGLFTMGVVEQAATVDPAADDWQRFEGPGFVVEFPAEPKVSHDAVDDPAFDVTNSYTYEDGYHYLKVTYLRLGDDGSWQKDARDLQLQDLVAHFRGRTVRDEEVTWPGQKFARGRRIELERPKVNERTVLIAVIYNSRGYILVANEANADQTAAARHFADSFELR
ncbi:MAG: hypothetical protein H6839_00320 [Planctomycetes bacterium]|nr:hypothetical protein [Planctomycetota bacterium]